MRFLFRWKIQVTRSLPCSFRETADRQARARPARGYSPALTKYKLESSKICGRAASRADAISRYIDLPDLRQAIT
jgi:hypothetical protein